MNRWWSTTRASCPCNNEEVRRGTVSAAREDCDGEATGEDNGDAHLKSLLLHHETTLPVTGGRLDLGTWQRVFYAEFDGQRGKRVIVKVLGVE